MKLHVLYAQRRCDYPGQYALEALACMDEYGHEDNPGYLEGKLETHQQTNEFDSLAIVELDVSESEVTRILYPAQGSIKAVVVTDSPASP